MSGQLDFPVAPNQPRSFEKENQDGDLERCIQNLGLVDAWLSRGTHPQIDAKRAAPAEQEPGAKQSNSNHSFAPGIASDAGVASRISAEMPTPIDYWHHNKFDFSPLTTFSFAAMNLCTTANYLQKTDGNSGARALFGVLAGGSAACTDAQRLYNCSSSTSSRLKNGIALAADLGLVAGSLYWFKSPGLGKIIVPLASRILVEFIPDDK